MKPRIHVEEVAIERIKPGPMPDRWGEDDTEDGKLVRTIERGGIQVPINLVRVEGELVRCKGSRRLGAARKLGIPKVPAVIEELPPGKKDADAYIERLYFIVTVKRQDPPPTVRAGYVVGIKKQYGMTNAAVAEFLGVDVDSITGWLRVLKYIKPVQDAMDGGTLTSHQARVFDGMSPEGQRHLWREHGAEICDTAGNQTKSWRKKYPPGKHPKFYSDAVKSAERSSRGPRGTKKVAAPSFTKSQKTKLMHSLEMQDDELAVALEKIESMDRECVAAGPPIAAILRNPKLRGLVPAEMLPELQRFSEVF